LHDQAGNDGIALYAVRFDKPRESLVDRSGESEGRITEMQKETASTDPRESVGVGALGFLRNVQLGVGGRVKSVGGYMCIWRVAG
jgi:hypothetical protein